MTDEYIDELYEHIPPTPEAISGNGHNPQVTPPEPELSPREDLQEAFNRFIELLPPEVRPKYRQINAKLSADCVAQSGDSSLEKLLPRLYLEYSSDILRKEFPPIHWVIPELLPPGMTFISGKPKVGKSWLALQLALAVMTGGKVFGKDVEAGRVLYLSLEDNLRRLQDRMKKQKWPIGPNVEFMLYDQFRDQIGSLNTGGGKRLLAHIEAQKYRLVVVDTFSRAVQGDQLDKEKMDSDIGPLQAYALRVDVALVMIDHMPKNAGSSGATDPIAHLYGSVAKSGVGDTFWGLYKEQGKPGAKLAIVGREIMESTLKLVFDINGFFWHCEGDANEIEMTTRRKEILDFLEEEGQADEKAISDTTGQARPHVHTRLQDLMNAGLVKKVDVGNKHYYSRK